MNNKTPITIAYGDGVGPEIMEATLGILEAADAPLEPETIQIGKKVYERGFSAGIEPSAWESLRRTKIFLKAPIMTPQGGGFKSLNVTIRKTLGLYANVRPCAAYAPFVRTRHPLMDVAIIRENEEDLYAGIEHRQTDEVIQCLKLITRPGCERIIRYAFEYASSHHRSKVTCMTKDNIMKLTDGLFHEVFGEIAAQYPDIKSEHMIVDIGAARLADSPERFDVLVLPNLYGDILSDIAAQISGSVGLAPSSNVGENGAMYEAIHGSAPDIAGRDIANPSGLLLSSVMMLIDIGQAKVAERVHNAWLKAVEDGFHTGDMFTEGLSARRVGTRDFARAVIERLGALPEKLKAANYSASASSSSALAGKKWERRAPLRKDLIGVDVFLHWRNGSPNDLGELLGRAGDDALKLVMITNRGVKVWPDGFPETFCTDHWRCRFVSPQNGKTISHRDIIGLLERVEGLGLDFIKLENLCNFDGKPGYSLGQGQ